MKKFTVSTAAGIALVVASMNVSADQSSTTGIFTLNDVQLDSAVAGRRWGWGSWGSSSANSGAAVITPGSTSVAAGSANSVGTGGTRAATVSSAAGYGEVNFYGAFGAGRAVSRSTSCQGRRC